MGCGPARAALHAPKVPVRGRYAPQRNTTEKNTADTGVSAQVFHVDMAVANGSMAAARAQNKRKRRAMPLQ
jgi:hypothetical protein